MKKLAVGLVTVVGLIGTPALAADMALKAPPAAPLPTWSGFYFGGNLGGAWSDPGPSYTNPTQTTVPVACATGFGSGAAGFTSGPFNLAGCTSGQGLIGGAQFGYNWQQGAFVYGLELDAAAQSVLATSYDAYVTSVGAPGLPMGTIRGDTAYFRDNLEGLETLRGRIGFSGAAPYGSWLLYGTGGLAIGQVQHSFTEVLSPGSACPFVNGSCRTTGDNTTRVGYAVGVGAEYLWHQVWSFGIEYLFVDLGRDTLTLAPPTPAGFFTGTSTAGFNDRENIVRLKVSYHFGAPVAP